MNDLILIVNHDSSADECLEAILRLDGHVIHRATSGELALAAMHDSPPDLLILELDDPNISGFDMLERIRQRDPYTRIIGISTQTDEGRCARALRTGANDYVSRPYSLLELSARVSVQLRDARLFARSRVAGGIRVNMAQGYVRIDGATLHLPPMELKLLRTLLERPNQLLNKRDLLRLVWGTTADLHTRTVETHVAQLRKHLRPFGLDHLLQTMRGHGLMWSTETGVALEA